MLCVRRASSSTSVLHMLVTLASFFRYFSVSDSSPLTQGRWQTRSRCHADHDTLVKHVYPETG